jgi:hypothetical protein
MSTSNAQRKATAYHEAGHAVVALFLGYKPRSATIIPAVDFHGQVKHDSPLRGIKLDIDDSDRARLRVERAIMICFAGPLAQQRYRPRSWRRWHGASDFQTAADLALRVSGSEEAATAFLRWLELQTRSIVIARWTLIDRVAQALLEHDKLVGRCAMCA